MTSTLGRQQQDLIANPDDQALFQTLEESLFLEADWDALVEIYATRLGAPVLADDPRGRAQLLFRQAQVLEERCRDLERAREVYWEAARLDPEMRAALRQVRSIHAIRNQWELVLQVAEMESQLPMRPFERAEFSAEMGEIWLNHLDDPGQAMACFDQALAAQPETQDALSGRARAMAALGRFEEAAECFESLIALQRGPDRVPSLVAYARILSGALRQPDRAMDIYRRALTDDPRSTEAVEALSMLASARENWELVGDLFERRFDLASGARRRTAIALDAGHHHLERMGDPQLARMWFQRAVELCPDDPAVQQAIAEVERRAGNTQPLRQALDRVADLSGDGTPLNVLIEAAALHSESGGTERALTYLRRAQRLEPENSLVLEPLSASLARLDRVSELVEVVEQRVAVASDGDAAQLAALSELGRLHEEHLDDPGSAIHAYSRVFEADRSNAEIGERLERLHRKAEDWGALRVFLEQARADGPSDVRGDRCCGLGEVLFEHFDDAAGAQTAFEAALALDPHSSRALEGLARIATESGDEDALLLAYRREAAVTADRARLRFLVTELLPRLESRGQNKEALEWAVRLAETCPEERNGHASAARLQEALGREDDCRASLRRLDALLQGAEQAENRRRLASLAADEDEAIEWFEQALQSDPSDLESLVALKTRYGRARRTDDQARVQRRLADLLPESERAECLDELSRLLEDQIGDLDAAIVVLWRLVEAPNRPDDAHDRLEDLLERTGRFEELAQLLMERRRGVVEDGDEAKRMDLRRAQLLLDHLGQVEQAAELFRSVRSSHPGDAAAREGLERALRAGNDPVALADLLGELARDEDDPAVRARLELECASLLEEEGGAPERARDAFASLADDAADPDVRREASDRLEALLERTGDWAMLRVRLERRLESLSNEDRLLLHPRLAALCRDRLSDRDGCIDHLEAAGRLDPSDASNWRSLAILYREADREADLARVIDAELGTEPDAERERALVGTAAQLAVEREDPEAATRHFERLLALAPGHADAVEYLVERYECEERTADVVELLESRLAVARDSAGNATEDLSLRLRIAAIRADGLDDLSGAVEILAAAPQVELTHATVSEPLADLYQRAGRGDDLIALAQQRARAESGNEEVCRWLMRMADALRAKGDADSITEAVAAYRGVLAHRPRDADAQAALREIHRSRGESEPLAQLLELQLDPASDEDPLPVLIELGTLLGGPLDRPEEALERFRQALLIDPDHRPAFGEAVTLAERLGLHPDMLALLEDRLAGHCTAIERCELLVRRAGLLAGPANRPGEAPPVYREALAIDVGNREAHRGLREVLETLERWPAVLDCLYVKARGANPRERVEILERAAEIAERHLSADASLPWLERLRAEQPDNSKVIRRIADVHRRAGRPEALLRALEDELALVDDPSRQRELHLERARVFERDLGALGRALPALEAARAIEGNDAVVLVALDRVCQALGRPRERAKVVEDRIALGSLPPEEACDLHRDVAELYEGALGDPSSAIAHRLRAVDLAGTNSDRTTALAALGTVLRAADRLDGWARAAESELALLEESDSDLDRRARLRMDLADAYAESLGRPDAAREHWITLLDGTSSSTLGADQRARVEGALIERLRADRDTVALEQRLAMRVERQGPDAEAGTWLELARLRDEQLASPVAAARAYREVLERRGGDVAAARGLRQVSERRADWSEVVRCLEVEVQATDASDGTHRAALLLRAGDLCWRRLADLDAASAAYVRALDASPKNLAAVRALGSLRLAQDDWREEAELGQRELELLGEDEPERRRDLWLRAAVIASDREQDRNAALAAYSAAADAAPLATPDLRTWALLYRESGDVRRFGEVFESWCDADDSPATCDDHLELAHVLEELGDAEAALARTARATETDPRRAAPWETAARIHEKRGDAVAASEALERAAAWREPSAAAAHQVRAARLVEEADAERALALLRAAVELDPGDASALAYRARLAEQQEEFEEAEQAAAVALDLSQDGDAAERLATALAGGRAARARRRLEPAARFFSAAVTLEAFHAEALEQLGEVLFELGDRAGARAALEARLEADEADPHRARHLALIGAGLEADGEPEAALARFQEALGEDPEDGDAHAGIARAHECAGRASEWADALAAWAAVTGEPRDRARRLVRAAKVRSDAGRRDDAETHLRAAIEADPQFADAWLELALALHEDGRNDDALEAAEAGIAAVTEPQARARLSRIQGRALEARGERGAAADAFGSAAAGDPTCAESALSRARLLRTAGRWNDSASALADFAAAHPMPGHADLARVHLERGRLMAGPLEDVAEAVRCYEQALAIRADLTEALEPLAGLLAHLPGRERDAIERHRALLEIEPTRAASLRALADIAGRGRTPSLRDGGLSLLRALGAASPTETTAAPARLPFKLGSDPALSDPVAEKLRGLVQEAGREIAEVLDAGAPPRIADARSEAEGGFLRALCEEEDRLGAPGLRSLPVEDLHGLLVSLAALALDPQSPVLDSGLGSALDRAVGRWGRRKLRRTLDGISLDQVRALDAGCWRDALRRLAARGAVDRCEGDLRTALISLTLDSDEPSWPTDSADVSRLAARSPEAEALLRRAVEQWCARVTGD